MAASPPPTPPSRLPKPGEFRFKQILNICEWVEDYHPGSLHPVSLGDVFKGGQYKVIRKLGDGSFSTVWLARDTQNDRYVALKMLKAAAEAPENETRILQFLAAVPGAEQHVVQLLDHFDLAGPNGTHRCLVFEPMGPSANGMLEQLPVFIQRTPTSKQRFPPATAKRILKEVLAGLCFLHEHGVAHGDLQPGNMLFSLADGFDRRAEDAVCQQRIAKSPFMPPDREPRRDPRSAPDYGRVKVERCDGKQDRWAPPYLYLAQPLAAFAPFAGNRFQIKLADMGGAFFFANPPRKVVTPVGLRPPELVLSGTAHPSMDIWSFGCLLFELITGRALFVLFGSEDDLDIDDDHLCQMTFCLGPLPEPLYRQWNNASLYFTPERRFYNMQLGGLDEGEEPDTEEQLKKFQESMEDLFDQEAPEVSAEEGRTIKALVRRILQYDPEQRPSAAEILQDPWFAEDEEEEEEEMVGDENVDPLTLVSRVRKAQGICTEAAAGDCHKDAPRLVLMPGK